MNNLLTNCVRHNAPGGSIRLGGQAEGKSVVLFVAGGAAAGIPSVADPARPLEADGGAAHGTGLKLVRQIAEAHGGTVQFRQGGIPWAGGFHFPTHKQCLKEGGRFLDRPPSCLLTAVIQWTIRY